MTSGVLLAAAIAAEVAATSALRAAGDGRLIAISAVALGYPVAILLLAVVVRRMDVGVVYAIWSGVGTATIAAIGMTVLDDEVSAARIGGLCLIISGVVILRTGGN